MEGSTPEPAVRFKRRRITHPRRTRFDTEEAENTAVSALQSPDAAPSGCPNMAHIPREEDGSSLALKELLRNRKKPRDRLREVGQRAHKTKTLALVQQDEVEAKHSPYANRFVAQTGQVVNEDDKQM